MKNSRFILVLVLVLSLYGCGEKPCAIYIIVHNESKYDITESDFDQDNHGAIVHPGEVKTFTYRYASGGTTGLYFKYTLNGKVFGSSFVSGTENADLRIFMGDGETVNVYINNDGYKIIMNNGKIYTGK